MSRIESADSLKGPSAAARVSNSNAVSPEAVQAAQNVSAVIAQQFISPVVTVDNSSGLAIIQYRDAQTGETEVQWPSPKAVQQYAARAVEPQEADQEAGSQSAATQQAPKSEAASAVADQASGGAPAEGATAPQSGAATAHVSLIA